MPLYGLCLCLCILVLKTLELWQEVQLYEDPDFFSVVGLTLVTGAVSTLKADAEVQHINMFVSMVALTSS